VSWTADRHVEIDDPRLRRHRDHDPSLQGLEGDRWQDRQGKLPIPADERLPADSGSREANRVAVDLDLARRREERWIECPAELRRIRPSVPVWVSRLPEPVRGAERSPRRHDGVEGHLTDGPVPAGIFSGRRLARRDRPPGRGLDTRLAGVGLGARPDPEAGHGPNRLSWNDPAGLDETLEGHPEAASRGEFELPLLEGQ